MTRRGAALLVLVGGVCLGLWLFRDARRAEVRFPVAGASPCVESLRLELREGEIVERTMTLRLDGPPLPPWTVSVRGDARTLFGEIRCRSGVREHFGPMRLEIRDGRDVRVDLAGRCSCPPDTE